MISFWFIAIVYSHHWQADGISRLVSSFFLPACNVVSCRLFVDAVAWSPAFAQDNTYIYSIHQIGTPRIASKPIDAHRVVQSPQAFVLLKIQASAISGNEM